MTARLAPSHVQRRRPQLIRRVGAALTLAAVTAGPPALLALLTGNPLSPPGQLRDGGALTTALDDRTVLWLLAAAAWLLWAHLLASLLIEVLRQVRGSAMRMPLPGLLFGANAALASHLVAALVLTGHPAAAHGLTPAAARTAAVSSAYPATSPDRPPQTHLPVVHDVDAWSAAHTDGAALPECRVLPPAGRDHDTLWDIAERHLGDGTRWRDIYRLNEGRLMPDGQRLTRASLIHPGWILSLPADAIDLDRPHSSTNGRTSGAPRASLPAQERPTPTVPQSPPAADQSRSLQEGPQPGEPRAQHPAEPTTASASAPNSAPAADGIHVTADDRDTNDPVAPVVLVSLLGLASVGTARALTRRRKVAARRRPLGVRSARPAHALRDLEAQLRQQARQAEDTAATVQLALQIAARHAAGSRLRALWQHPDGSLELVLTEPAPDRPAPAPFEMTDRGWLLPTTALKYVTPYREPAGRRAGGPDEQHPTAEPPADPFPLLLPVGTRNGSACLVNLELYGLISVSSDDPVRDERAGATFHPLDSADTADSALTADPAAAAAAPVTVAGLIGAWVQALDAAPWADRVRIHLPDSLGAIATARPHVQVADRGSRDDGDSSQTGSGLSEHEREVVTDSGSLEAARRTDPDTALIGLTLHAGYRADQLPPRLLTAAADPHDPNVVLLTGAHPDAHIWRLDHHGILHIPGVADDLQPLALDPEQQQLLLRLLEHAQDPPHALADDLDHAELIADCPPLPPAPQSDPASASVPDPSLRHVIDLTHADATPPTEAPPTERTPMLPTSDGTDSPATVPAAAASPTDALPATPASDQVDQPHQRDGSSFVEVCVLGPLTVHGTDEPVKRQPALEALTYLALHHRPVRLEMLWTALFPHKPYDNKQLGNRLSDLRRSIGTRLVRVTTSTYELDDRVVTDWQRFQGLAGGNPQQQLEALALVRGRPFDGSPLDWFQLEGQYAEIEASIVDLALQVGERALRNRDYDTARTAALAGLRGCPWEERLYRIAMQSAAARGASAELHQLRRQLQIVLDDELDPDDDIQPATQDLYTRLRDEEERRRRVDQRRVGGG